MALQLTAGSAPAYETILYGNMTPSMAAEYLRQKRILVRSFSGTLRTMYTGKDISKRILNFYTDIFPDVSRSSLRRRIRNWLSDQNRPQDREDYFRIAFALRLQENQLNFLLGISTDYAIQYRDGREAILSWFLRNGFTYQEAMAFYDTLPVWTESRSGNLTDKRDLTDKKDLTDKGKMTDKKDLTDKREMADGRERPGRRKAMSGDKTGEAGRKGTTSGDKTADMPDENTRITREILNEFRMVHSLNDLRACYRRNLSRFGKLHLRSYYYFDQYLQLLLRPETPGQGDPSRSHGNESDTDCETPDSVAAKEPDYSIETVMDTYLSLHMPSGKNRAGFSVVQKLIKQNWPNATSIKNIRNHVEDVPRKVLLLLYVVTENTGMNDAYREIDEEYITLEDRLEDHWWTLNALLSDCGMAPLDLRNAFDWLILYAVSADGNEAMSDRLEGVISELFRQQ